MRPAIIAIVLAAALIVGRIEAAPFDFYCGKAFITFKVTTAPANLLTYRKADIVSLALMNGREFLVRMNPGQEYGDALRIYVPREFHKAFVECLD